MMLKNDENRVAASLGKSPEAILLSLGAREFFPSLRKNQMVTIPLSGRACLVGKCRTTRSGSSFQKPNDINRGPLVRGNSALPLSFILIYSEHEG